jgi:hypothetical protein
VGINVHLQDERGEDIQVVSDPGMLLNKLLGKTEIQNSTCLRFVMQFADTTFNQAQVSVLLGELAGLRAGLDEKSLRLIDAIIRLAEQAERRPHLYLKFIGD